MQNVEKELQDTNSASALYPVRGISVKERCGDVQEMLVMGVVFCCGKMGGWNLDPSGGRNS